MVRTIKASSAAILGLFLAYLAARVYMMLGGEVFTSHDAAVYAPRGDARDKGPLVSFIGDAPRPWGLPVFYAIFATDQARAIAQSVLGTLAWGFLAWELSRHIRSGVAKGFAVAAILGLALLNTVESWDFAILTESTSISIGVAVIACYLRWVRTRSKVVLGAMTVLAVWWTFIRPDIRIFIAVIVFLLAAYVWRRLRTGERAAARPAFVAAIVMLLAVGWYIAITPAMDQAFKPYDGDAILENPLPKDEFLLVYRLRVDVSTDPALQQTFEEKLGMPRCPETDRFIGQPGGWQTVEWARAYTRCPQLQAWARKQDYGFWGPLAKEAPAEAARKLYESTSSTLSGDIYAKTPQVIPGQIERLVFPSRKHGLPISAVFLAISLGVALAVGAWRLHPLLLKAGLVISVAAIGSALATVLVHSGEYRRFGMQETVAVRIAVILFLVAALDALVQRVRSKGSSEQAAAASVDERQQERSAA